MRVLHVVGSLLRSSLASSQGQHGRGRRTEASAACRADPADLSDASTSKGKQNGVRSLWLIYIFLFLLFPHWLDRVCLSCYPPISICRVMQQLTGFRAQLAQYA